MLAADTCLSVKLKIKVTVLKRRYICRSFYNLVVKTTKGCSSEIRTWSDPHHRWYGLDVRRRIHTEAGSDRPTKDGLNDAYDGRTHLRASRLIFGL